MPPNLLAIRSALYGRGQIGFGRLLFYHKEFPGHVALETKTAYISHHPDKQRERERLGRTHVPDAPKLFQNMFIDRFGSFFATKQDDEAIYGPPKRALLVPDVNISIVEKQMAERLSFERNVGEWMVETNKNQEEFERRMVCGTCRYQLADVPEVSAAENCITLVTLMLGMSLPPDRADEIFKSEVIRELSMTQISKLPREFITRFGDRFGIREIEPDLSLSQLENR